LVEPVVNTTVSGVVLLRAAVNDPAGISTVVFAVDSATVQTLQGAPWEMRWDSTTVGPGSHTVVVTANGASGSVAVTQIPILVHNTPAAPAAGCAAAAGSPLFVAALALVAAAARRKSRKRSLAHRG